MNAYDILSTKDNGNDIGTKVVPEMGPKETKSTKGTAYNNPVTGEISK